MIAIIERLLASGHAYAAEGHVLFSVASFPDYGRLSGRSPDEMLAGARVEVAPYKRDPGDFVLWKPSDAGNAGLGQPLGPRPPRLAHRVHCDVLALSRRDFRHPRRRPRPAVPAPRERAGAEPVRLPRQPPSHAYWLHNGMLQVGGEKMSKSLGNFLTLHDALAAWPGEVLRLLLLRAPLPRGRWISPRRRSAEARQELDRFYRALERHGRRGRGGARASAGGAVRRPQHAARGLAPARAGGRGAGRAMPRRLSGLRAARRCSACSVRRRRTGSRAARTRPPSRPAHGGTPGGAHARATSPAPTRSATILPRAASLSRTGRTGSTWRRAT